MVLNKPRPSADQNSRSDVHIGDHQRALLTGRELYLNFGGIQAIAGVTIDVFEGEVLGIVGPNGAGKSALLNCVNGVYQPASGEISFDGQRIEKMAAHRVARLGVGRSWQTTGYFRDFRVIDYLLLGSDVEDAGTLLGNALRLPGVRRREFNERERCTALLREFSLERYAYSALSSLPYGVGKQVDMLRVYASSPRLILLDEPTSGVARQDRTEIASMIRMFHTPSTGTVVVDHDVKFVSALCDRIVVMSAGEVLAVGEPEEVFKQRNVIASYLGDSQ